MSSPELFKALSETTVPTYSLKLEHHTRSPHPSNVHRCWSVIVNPDFIWFPQSPMLVIPMYFPADSVLPYFVPLHYFSVPIILA